MNVISDLYKPFYGHWETPTSERFLQVFHNSLTYYVICSAARIIKT